MTTTTDKVENIPKIDKILNRFRTAVAVPTVPVASPLMLPIISIHQRTRLMLIANGIVYNAKKIGQINRDTIYFCAAS